MNERPVLSANDIENRASGLLRQLAPQVLLRPTKTPILEIVLEQVKAQRLLFDACQDLGHTATGRKILGIFLRSPPSILIDAALAQGEQDEKFRFTLTHEFAHYILHGNASRAASGAEAELVDTEAEIFKLYASLGTGKLAAWLEKRSDSKRNLETPRDWLEWQANRLAAALLMPSDTVQKGLEEVQDDLEIYTNRGRIFVENLSYSIRDFKNQIRGLASKYFVSPTVARIRLDSLGLIRDTR